MAKVKPFNGIRYNEKEATKLICPPYDVIPPAEKERLKKLSPYNMVKLELSDPAGKLNKYQTASSLLIAWLEKGVLTADEVPAYYVYEQQFTDHGKKMVRRGFFAALHLEDPHSGVVKPHERTLAGPKADRLKLLRAVKANLSPIFGLFHDNGKKILNYAKKLSRTREITRARDSEGTLHRVWKVDDPKATAMIGAALNGRDIFIADGHHRYETAWNYSQERKKKDKRFSSEAEYNYVLAFLCPMDEPGLSIWPTHRVVEPPADLEERIAANFNVLPAGAFAKLSGKSPQPIMVSINGKSRTLAIKNKSILAKAMPDKCQAYRDLGVSILHSLLLAGVAPEKITYVKDEKETLKLARGRKCLAVIVPATPVNAIKKIALAGQTMPQKSTYFFPKVASGIVIHALDPNNRGR